MNINELDSYNLAEAAKFKDALNPVIWDRHEHLKNAVKDQIMVGIDEYCQYLGLNESHIADILVAGDNAGYAYSPNSTIDVVVVANLDPDPVYRELFNENKYKYNGQHQVKIDNQYVQFYVQSSDEPVVSRGSYSLLREDWVQVPVRKLAESNDTVAKLKKLVEAATPVPVIKPRKAVVKETKPVKYGYGSDYIAEVGMTPDGTNPTTCQVCNEEIPLAEVGMTPDGTNPTTCQVCNEQNKTSEEDLIKDFINFCSDSLGLENPVNLKLKRDPEWSKRNKTFGRYNSDTDLLEVAIGQRHIMDTFRTVAHELTHKRQHEVSHVPEDAGETGSKFENEANAAAGVLMRTWAQRHPEFFALPDMNEDDQDVENGTAPLGPETPPEFPAGTVKVDVSDVYDWYKLGQNISNLDHIDPDTLGKGPPQTILAFGSEPEEHKYMKQLKKLGLKTHDIDPSWYHDVDESEEMVDEGLGQKLAAATAVVAALAGNPAAAQSVQGIIGSIQNIGTMVRTAQNITRAGINQEVQQEIINYIQANSGQANAQNLSHLYKLQRELQNQESDQQPLPGYMQQANPSANEGFGASTPAGEKILAWQNTPLDGRKYTSQGYTIEFTPTGIEIRKGADLVYRKEGDYSNPTNQHLVKARRMTSILSQGWKSKDLEESASGYIPTKAQAKDPRYSMALTVDIKPGAVGKNANKLKLNTNSQGEPQLANPNGLVQRMSEELELFKKGFNT